MFSMRSKIKCQFVESHQTHNIFLKSCINDDQGRSEALKISELPLTEFLRLMESSGHS